MNFLKPKPTLNWFLLLTAVEASICIILFSLIPRNAENSWLFGFSKARLGLLIVLLIPFAVSTLIVIVIRYRPDLTQRIEPYLSQKLGDVQVLSLVLNLASAGTVLGAGLLLVQLWITDNQVLGILRILNPLILFETILSAQLLLFTVARAPKKWSRLWLLSLGFMVTLLVLQFYLVPENSRSVSLLYAPPFLLLGALSGHVLVLLWVRNPQKKTWVAGFTLASGFFVLNFMVLSQPYRDRLLPYVPTFILLSMTLIGGYFILDSRLSDSMWKRMVLWAVLGIVTIFLLFFYYDTADEHSQKINTETKRSNQRDYVAFSRRARATDFTYTGERNRMPLYPFLQAIFNDTGLGNQAFFDRGKQINIILSMILIPVLFLIFRKYLSLHQSINLTLATAFSLHIFKAAYFQPELLFYFLNFVMFLTMGIMLVRPSIKVGIIVGVIAGLAHLTKASILPELILFIAIYIGKESFSFLRARLRTANTLESYQVKTRGVALLLLVVSYLVVVFPYIKESKDVYGSYFFNVNSNFYIWFDGWLQWKYIDSAIGEDYTDLEWRNVPPEQLPGPVNYFRTRGLQRIVERLTSGLQAQLTHLGSSYSLFNYSLAFLYLFIAMALIHYRALKIIGSKHIHLIFFTLAYFAGYTVLFGFYFAIAGGPRFILSLYIPAIFSFAIAIQALVREASANPGKENRATPQIILKISEWLVSLILFADIYFVLTELVGRGYFGT